MLEVSEVADRVVLDLAAGEGTALPEVSHVVGRGGPILTAAHGTVLPEVRQAVKRWQLPQRGSS